MLANDEEDSDPGESDAEAEHEEARQSLNDIAELVAALTSKLDEAQGRGAKTRKLNVPIEVLLRAKRLLQDPEAAQGETEQDIARESDHAATSQRFSCQKPHLLRWQRALLHRALNRCFFKFLSVSDFRVLI